MVQRIYKNSSDTSLTYIQLLMGWTVLIDHWTYGSNQIKSNQIKQLGNAQGLPIKNHLITWPTIQPIYKKWNLKTIFLASYHGSTHEEIVLSCQFRSGNLKTICFASNNGKTQKTRFLTMVRQENPNPIGYKFRFTHLNRFCLVLPWLDARRNRV